MSSSSHSPRKNTLPHPIPFPARVSGRKFVTELPTQGAVDQVFLASRKQLRPNRHGQLYLQVELADRSGSITGRMWNASDYQFEAFDDGEFVQVEGVTQVYSGNLQVIIQSISRADPRLVDESEFRVLTDDDLCALRVELTEILSTIEHPQLAACISETLSDEDLMTAVTRSPAGIKQHHAYAGGLLEHIVSLLRIADRVAPLYPDLSRDLLLVGILFHDIGKTSELESEQGFSYTDAGQLLGHIVLGLEIIEEKIQAAEHRLGTPFDAELVSRIKHMVASHHGEYEYGSPKLPMTLEAVALHHIDQLDARMAATTQLLRNEAALDGGWTQYHTNLGRKFFRGKEK
ncbi:MAG: HD domain-containing protein [Pirellulales bacterium]